MGEMGKWEMTPAQGKVGRDCNWGTGREEAAKEGDTRLTRMEKDDEVLLFHFSFGINWQNSVKREI